MSVCVCMRNVFVHTYFCVSALGLSIGRYQVFSFIILYLSPLRQSLTELGASMAAYIPSNPPVSTLHSAGITGKHGHAQVFA